MKKLLLFTALSFVCHLCAAQFSTSNGNTTTLDKVGIGTASPAAPLEVYSTINTQASPLISIRSNFHVTGNYGMIRFGDQTQTINYQKGALIYESVGGSSRGKFHLALENTDGIGSVSLADAKLTVLSNGFVGIGESNPTEKLVIRGGNLSMYNTGLPTVALLGSTLIGKTYLNLSTSGDAGGFSTIQSVKASGSAYGTLGLNSGGGNVGIGTVNPGSTLSVLSGNTGISIHPGGAPYFGTIGFNRESGSGTIFNTAGNAFQINNGPDDNLHFQTYSRTGNQVEPNSLVIMGSSGNVGIGTADTRGFKLAVAGPAIATEVTVKSLSQWPDYVFAPQYMLPSLSSVKAFVAQNRHLPELPSAQDVARQGVALGELNRLLVKKLEELTLYLMKQQDQIEELHKKVNALSRHSSGQ